MKELIQKASVLIEALPYIREFEGKTVVIKYGGSAMLDGKLRKSTAEDVVLMKYVGMNPVIVHGGGPAINRNLDRMQIGTRFENGLRVTDKDTIEVVEMVLTGNVNTDIVTLINVAGGKAVGLCGKDADLFHAEKINTPDGKDVGYVGKITKVNREVIDALWNADMIPVIAPIATDMEGGTWNINADTLAGAIAAELKAEKLVFLTDTPGLLSDVNDPGSLIQRLCYADVEELKRDGVIAGGMIPKVDACFNALNHGVPRTHIIDGRVSHSMLLEIFTDKGLGTCVSMEPF